MGIRQISENKVKCNRRYLFVEFTKNLLKVNDFIKYCMALTGHSLLPVGYKGKTMVWTLNVYTCSHTNTAVATGTHMFIGICIVVILLNVSELASL